MKYVALPLLLALAACYGDPPAPAPTATATNHDVDECPRADGEPCR